MKTRIKFCAIYSHFYPSFQRKRKSCFHSDNCFLLPRTLYYSSAVPLLLKLSFSLHLHSYSIFRVKLYTARTWILNLNLNLTKTKKLNRTCCHCFSNGLAKCETQHIPAIVCCQEVRSVYFLVFIILRWKSNVLCFISANLWLFSIVWNLALLNL